MVEKLCISLRDARGRNYTIENWAGSPVLHIINYNGDYLGAVTITELVSYLREQCDRWNQKYINEVLEKIKEEEDNES